MDKTPMNGAYIYTMDSNNDQHIIKLVDDIRILPQSYIEDIAAFNMSTYLKSGQHMKMRLNIITNSIEETSMNLRQQKIYDDLLITAKNNSWEVISNHYTNTNTKMKFMCPKGHIREIAPSSFKQKPACSTCSEHCSVLSEVRFRLIIAKMGGIVLGKYSRYQDPVECICSKNHKCFPTLRNIERKDRQSTKRWMCTECSGCSSIVAERLFNEFVTSNGGIVNGKYINRRTRVECLCSKGHVCRPTFQKVRALGSFCGSCIDRNTSYGEKLIIEVLENMKIKFTPEYRHPLTPKLRYDFMFTLGEKTYYIEYDGEQHFKKMPFFHKKDEFFNEQRQRDLLKNYIVSLEKNSVLIRIDYKWCKKKNLMKRPNVILDLTKHIKECLASEGKIFTNNNLYTWLDDPLSKDITEKYYNGTLDDSFFIEDFDVDEFIDELINDEFIDDELIDDELIDDELIDDELIDDELIDDELIDDEPKENKI